MRFLLDENLSPAPGPVLQDAGHDCEHVRDIDMAGAPGDAVLHRARSTGSVLVTADTDFGELLARSNASTPSLILFRRQHGRRARALGELVLANLGDFAADLDSGSIVVV